MLAMQVHPSDEAMDFSQSFTRRRLPGEVRVPAKSTIHAVLDRHGLVKRMGRKRTRAHGTPLSPGNPQQNGRHERMHLTLKKQATRPPGTNSLQQQTIFDGFLQEFNCERPHEALNMKCPAEVYTPSTREYTGLPELYYPFHDRPVLVTACGRICI